MRQRLLLTLLAAFTLVAALSTASVAQKGPGPSKADAKAKPTRYVLPGATVFPEGIATQPGTKRFYVGSTTDGTIFRGDVTKPQTKVLSRGGAGGRTTAIGMKADKRGRLIVAGGGTGKVFVLQSSSGKTLATLDTKPGTTPTFLNDVALANGYAYITDSQRPILYRVKLGKKARDIGAIEPYVDFTGTAFAYQPGFNANGIVASKDGRYLAIVQSGTGKLFRVDTTRVGEADKGVSEVDLGGATVPNGDGLLLVGSTLFVAQNRQELITPIRVPADLASGVVGTGVTSPTLKFPTTLALDRGRLLIVNAQFDKRGPGLTPETPFDVVALAPPAA